MRPQSGHLWQMGDGYHLNPLANALHHFSDFIRDFSRNTGIHFIKNY